MADDDYRSRMLAIVEDLHAQGVGRYLAAPPIYRLAWKLGIRVPPPVYHSFKALVLQIGIPFGLAWGIVMWSLFWRNDKNFSPLLAVFTSLIAGIAFGISMAGVYRRLAEDVRLPPLE